MDLFLHKSLFHYYFKETSFKNNEHQIVSGIINNNYNKIFINKDLWETIINEIDADSPLIDYYQQLLTGLTSDGAVITFKAETNFKKDYDNSIELCYRKYLGDSKNNGRASAYISFDYSSTITVGSKAAIGQMKRPNIDWLICYVASVNPRPISVRYFDFKTDKEIIDFISSVVLLINNPDIAWIFDRQRNTNHSLFDAIIGKVRFHYMTLHNFSNSQNRYILSDLTAKYRSNIVFSAPAKIIHERMLILGDIIIDMDEDFENIQISRPTWKIDVTLCATTVGNLLKKKSFFKRVV